MNILEKVIDILSIANISIIKNFLDTLNIFPPTLFLGIICMVGRLDILKLFFERGVNLNHTDSVGKTPLHIACFYQNIDIIEFLIDNGANPNAKNYEGLTPLHDACANGYTNIIILLINKGCDINVRANDGVTPLHVATINNHIHIIPILTERGANLESKDNVGLTPLHYASEDDFYGFAMSTLLDKKANIEAKTNNRKTPIHYACKNGNFKILEILIKYKANLNETASNDKNALHFAAYYNHPDICIFLINQGMNPTLKDKKGKTALSHYGYKSFFPISSSQKSNNIKRLKVAYEAYLKKIRDENWARKSAFMLTMVNAGFHHLDKKRKADKELQEQLDKKMKLSPISRKTKEENKAYLVSQVFSQEINVKTIGSYL